MSDEHIPKPRELLAARTSAEELFRLLRRWFDVPESVEIDLREVDSAVAELSDPVLVMAMAMRKLQALHLITTPGVLTTTDVVLTVIQDLERALLQAPSMHLRDAAAATDWDAEFAALDGSRGMDSGNGAADGNGDGRGSHGADGAAESDAPPEDDVDDARLGDAELHRFSIGGPDDPVLTDDEIALFRTHHRALHEAARAVLRASDGQIRRMI